MNRYKFDEQKHIHSLDGKSLCGTSTVVSILAKPLAWWYSGKAVELLGWTNKNLEPSTDKRLENLQPYYDKIHNMGPGQFLALLDKAYANHQTSLKQSAEKGTDLHAELEKYVKSQMDNKTVEYDPQIQPFVDWCKKFVKKFLFSEVHVYSEKLWLGGIIDCGVEMHNGDIGVIDFKSAKDSYYEHFLQCAGYVIQLEENGGYTPAGDKIFSLDKPVEFMAVLPFGADDKIPRTNHDIEDFKKSYEATLQIYKHKQDYGK